MNVALVISNNVLVAVLLDPGSFFDDLLVLVEQSVLVLDRGESGGDVPQPSEAAFQLRELLLQVVNDLVPVLASGGVGRVGAHAVAPGRGHHGLRVVA